MNKLSPAYLVLSARNRGCFSTGSGQNPHQTPNCRPVVRLHYPRQAPPNHGDAALEPLNGVLLHHCNKQQHGDEDGLAV